MTTSKAKQPPKAPRMCAYCGRISRKKVAGVQVCARCADLPALDQGSARG